ncbi:hypothetical protein [Burkholderia ambifaria]
MSRRQPPIDVAQWQECARTILADPRLDQIARAHANARPTERNPAWLNSHRDMGYLLRLLERYARGEIFG